MELGCEGARWAVVMASQCGSEGAFRQLNGVLCNSIFLGCFCLPPSRLRKLSQRAIPRFLPAR
jgi:hypothetical protein